MKSNRDCEGYCGVRCVDGNCPNALDELDRNSDTDAYECYHLEHKLKCKDCWYNKGCESCVFNGKKECLKNWRTK